MVAYVAREGCSGSGELLVLHLTGLGLLCVRTLASTQDYTKRFHHESKGLMETVSTFTHSIFLFCPYSTNSLTVLYLPFLKAVTSLLLSHQHFVELCWGIDIQSKACGYAYETQGCCAQPRGTCWMEQSV